MKVQLALDDIALRDAVDLCLRVAEHVDIVEVGTPPILEEGMRAVRALREALPHHEILADTKIMDAGAYEAGQAFGAGADYCTVLGVTDDRTIQACLAAAAERGAGVFVDLICVADVAARTRALQALGANLIAVHTGVDLQAAGVTPLDELLEVAAAASGATISVAGGISSSTAPAYLEAGADIVVVGSGIVRAADPSAEAAAIARIARRGPAARRTSRGR